MPATDQAPTVGRQPKTVTIDGRQYRLTPLAPRKAFRVTFRVVKLIGEPIASLLSGAGMQTELPDPNNEGEKLRITFEDVQHSAIAREALLGRLIASLSSATDDDMDYIVDELIVGQVEVYEGGGWLPMVTPEFVDGYVNSLWGLLQLLREAFQLSLLPTFAADDTPEASSEAETPESPAATS